MKIYFVRHGESETNAGDIMLGSVSKLTQKGREQATFVAKRFEKIPIDIILSSTKTRAKMTAEIINAVLKKQIIYSDLLIERKWPKEQVGKSRKDPELIKMYKQLWENFNVSGWHYSDEENVEDLMERGFKTLAFIKKQKAENILVVTHGLFMRMIIACITMGETLTSKEFWRFMITFETENTGITVCEREDVVSGIRDNEWKIYSWNDSAHLG